MSRKNNKAEETLSRRERQIMDVVYKLKQATVSDVLEHMENPPGYNSIRVTLGILEKKGKLKHKKEGQKFVYQPTVSREKARRSALDRVLQIFFEGSAPNAVSTLLDLKGEGISNHELDEISRLIQDARDLRDASATS